jgi:hypothetical protein
LVTIAKQCPPFIKLVLFKLTSEQLLHVLGFNAWGVGSVPQDATSWMEKDDDLQEMIQSTCFVYMTIEDGTGCQKLGLKVHYSKSDRRVDRCIRCPWI